MISGYLLIYNVVNISVLQEMHMYGQLKTLGAAAGQLKGIVKRQSDMVALIGIPLGLLFGTMFSHLVIPEFLRRLMAGNGFGDRMSYDMNISPFIFLFSILFAYLTVVLSNRKPSKMAAKVSPVEALKYVEHTEKMKAHHGSGGGKLYRMAYRNVFRSKKRACVTFASLFFGMVIYLVVASCTQDADYEEKYKREQPDSFTLQNLSFQTENVSAVEDLLDEGTVERIRSFSGVQEMQADYVQPALFQEAETALKPYLEEQAMYRELSPEETARDFQARFVGLPLSQLEQFTYKSTLKEAQIRKYLESGTGIFLTDDGICSYKDISGKSVVLSDRKNPQKTSTFTILGYLTVNRDDNSYRKDWQFYGEVRDNAAVCYTTVAGIERLSQAPVIQTLRIQSDPSCDREIQKKLEEMFAYTDAVKINSKWKTGQSVTEIMQLLSTIGTIFAAFLMFMGLVNFINVIFTNIYSRQKELAMLESIGMTQKQLKSVLVMEGTYYSMITMVLLCTVGIAVSRFASQFIKNGLIYFVQFKIPVMQLTAVFLIMLVISVLVVQLVYHNITRESVVERLRKGQD